MLMDKTNTERLRAIHDQYGPEEILRTLAEFRDASTMPDDVEAQRIADRETEVLIKCAGLLENDQPFPEHYTVG